MAGSGPGDALEHAKETSLTAESGAAPDVVDRELGPAKELLGVSNLQLSKKRRQRLSEDGSKDFADVRTCLFQLRCERCYLNDPAALKAAVKVPLDRA